MGYPARLKMRPPHSVNLMPCLLGDALSPRHEPRKPRILSDWIEKRIEAEPWRTWKAGIDRAFEPVEAGGGIFQLSECGTNAVRNVVIGIRSAKNRRQSRLGIPAAALRGFD
jgi:hypothetical protein